MKITQKIIAKADNKFGNKNWYNSLRTDYVLRTLVISACGTVVTIGFAIYNGVLGARNSSLWHGVWAAYLIILALQRLLVISVFTIVGKKCGGDTEKLEREKLKIYLANGIVFVPIAITLSAIIALLISSRKPIVSNEILAIATAAYAFYKISMAIKNVTKAKLIKDPIVQTVRNAGLIDAIVSIILLESTLIANFGKLNYAMFVTIAVSGLMGCVFAIAVGTYMIITGAKRLHISKIEK